MAEIIQFLKFLTDFNIINFKITNIYIFQLLTMSPSKSVFLSYYRSILAPISKSKLLPWRICLWGDPKSEADVYTYFIFIKFTLNPCPKEIKNNKTKLKIKLAKTDVHTSDST